MTRMAKHRITTTGRLATATVVAAGLMALTPATAFAQSHPAPPRAVTESLQRGGKAYGDAVRLGATDDKGVVDADAQRALQDTATFGTPRLYYYYWEPTSKLSSATTFTEDDFYLDRGLRWLSVESTHGKATSVVETDQDGNVDAVAEWSERSMKLIDALPADAIVMTDGRYDETYAISGDRTTITALTAGAKDVIGSKGVDAATFRTAKAEQALEVAAIEKDQHPSSDSVGGMPVLHPHPSGSSALTVVELAGGAALMLGGVALLTWRRRHDRPLAPAVAD